jgi:phosphate transport system permease protein
MAAPRSFTGRRRQRQTRLSVRIADKAARSIITVGGIGTIVAVSTVFLFLFWVVWPLFLPASVSGYRRATVSGVPPLRAGVDEQQLIGWSL